MWRLYKTSIHLNFCHTEPSQDLDFKAVPISVNDTFKIFQALAIFV